MGGRPVDDKPSDTLVVGFRRRVLDGEFDSPPSPPTRSQDDAPTDLVGFAADAAADPMDPETREARLLGGPVPTVPELAAQAGPISHVRPDAPPFLLLHGEADRFIPFVQSVRLHTALVEAGARAELYLYEDADHMWLGSPEAAEQALDRTIDHLRRLLQDEPTKEEER